MYTRIHGKNVNISYFFDTFNKPWRLKPRKIRYSTTIPNMEQVLHTEFSNGSASKLYRLLLSTIRLPNVVLHSFKPYSVSKFWRLYENRSKWWAMSSHIGWKVLKRRDKRFASARERDSRSGHLRASKAYLVPVEGTEGNASAPDILENVYYFFFFYKINTTIIVQLARWTDGQFKPFVLYSWTPIKFDPPNSIDYVCDPREKIDPR